MTKEEIEDYSNKIYNDFVKDELELNDCQLILQYVLARVLEQSIRKVGFLPSGVCKFMQRSTGKKYKLIVKLKRIWL